ncbi:hypothetical protein ACJ72_06328 [Emergomyces africanus]|uniref:Uncharacterized protein n=1 Tax=Emergomyces africanus TaxID=1955775 RepID=A0A1B7NRE1_9EURO|nr:hypothetical protein ACJ72_06328 [Emergomyces africanus]
MPKFTKFNILHRPKIVNLPMVNNESVYTRMALSNNQPTHQEAMRTGRRHSSRPGVCSMQHGSRISAYTRFAFTVTSPQTRTLSLPDLDSFCSYSLYTYKTEGMLSHSPPSPPSPPWSQNAPLNSPAEILQSWLSKHGVFSDVVDRLSTKIQPPTTHL